MGILNSGVENKPTALVAVVIVATVVFFVGRVVRNAFFGPLSHIPGPKITAISRAPYARHLINGTVDTYLEALHKKYGNVVRFSPNEVSFIDGETAWPDIYGFRTGKMKGHLNMQKDPVWYAQPINGTPSILIANDEDHTRGRRLLSHAFSEKALAEQEQLVQNYVDQLVDRVDEASTTTGKAVDMEAWYTWTSFDIINDLTFGEPLGCLQDQKTHKYITLLAKSIQAFRVSYVLTYYPWLKRFGKFLLDSDIWSNRIEFYNWVKSQTTKRLDRETQRPDFMTHILKHSSQQSDPSIPNKKSQYLSKDEIDSNAILFLTAGSETTATLLAGVTYLLLANPSKLSLLKSEIRSLWKSYEDITIDKVNNDAPYLLAVLKEALRCFPPVPAGFQRKVGKGGEMVSGYFVPEGTGVSFSHKAAYSCEENFGDAGEYVPERWLGDPKYDGDRKAVLQPFSTGPRNCIGKNLAYAEMRLILAKMVWTFDMELEEESRDWMKRCHVMTLWQKPELLVKLKRVVRD